MIHHLISGPAVWTPPPDELEPLEVERVRDLVLVDHDAGVGLVLVLHRDDLELGPPVGGGAPADDR